MQPVYFASCSSEPTDAKYGMDPNLGFFAGSEPDSSLLNEPDWNRYSRDNNSVDCISDRNSGRSTGISNPGGSWSEPTIEDLTNYPNKNTLISLKSGFQIVSEDNGNANHSFLWHPSNSYVDIDSSGKMICKNSSDFYHIAGGLYQYIINNIRTTVGGSFDMETGGDYILESGGKIDMEATSTVTLKANGGIVNIIGSTAINLQGPVNMI
jgi:hypothetical protein